MGAEIQMRLKEIRTHEGLTQAAFGEKLGGYDHRTVSAYENGRSEPSDEYLRSVAKVFGVEWEKPGTLFSAASFNESGDPASKDLVVRMHKAELQECRAALLWIVSHLDDDQIEEIYSAVRKDRRITHAQKMAVNDALLVEQERRERRAVPGN